MQSESAPTSDALPNLSSEPSRPYRRFWLIVLAASPALLPLIVFYKYHVDFIWNDAWDMATILVKSHDHTLRISDFLAFHNEHRMPIPYLIMFVLAKLTHWNTMAELLFGYAMVCLLSLLLAKLLKITIGSTRLPLWPWFLINLLIFNPTQGENWGFGFAACQNFIPLPCIAAAIMLLSWREPNWKTVGLAAILIELASLSLTIGLLGWLIIVPLLLCWPSIKRARVTACWIGLMFIGLVVQFWGYRPYAVQSRYYAASISNRIQFFFAFLGNPLNHGASTSFGLTIGLGLVLFVVFIFLVIQCSRTWIVGHHRMVHIMLPWLILGAYAIGAAVLGASGRAGSGVQQAMTGRYITISAALLVCMVGLASFSGTTKRWVKVGRVIGSGVILVTVVIGAFRANDDFAGAVRSRRAGVAHLTFIDLVFEPYAQLLVGIDEHLREKADVLDEMGYIRPSLIKSSDLRPLIVPGEDLNNPDPSHGTIEDGTQTREGNLQVWGWTILPHENRAADMVIISCDDEMNVPRVIATGQVGSLRNDVAKSFGDQFKFCGWAASIPINRLPTGSRLIRCWAYDAMNQQVFLLPGLAIRTAEK
ncbi:MAG TPA: hypothetical protein VHD56_10825 [Tepidisphaeraceae bacterium]|nr:hypothetical protein [Tepidisphaeraceae bacterium]